MAFNGGFYFFLEGVKTLHAWRVMLLNYVELNGEVFFYFN